jgi:hypothetical protein
MIPHDTVELGRVRDPVAPDSISAARSWASTFTLSSTATASVAGIDYDGDGVSRVTSTKSEGRGTITASDAGDAIVVVLRVKAVVSKTAAMAYKDHYDGVVRPLRRRHSHRTPS